MAETSAPPPRNRQRTYSVRTLPGFAAIAITILGRYRGLRVTEIGRFFPIWYEAWRRRQGLPVAETTLGNRVAFAASMMEGKGVVESHHLSPAADEIRALAAELEKRLSV